MFNIENYKYPLSSTGSILSNTDDSLVSRLRKTMTNTSHQPFNRNIQLRHEISNNVVYATSKASDQPAHTRSLIRAFASRDCKATDRTSFGISKLTK